MKQKLRTPKILNTIQNKIPIPPFIFYLSMVLVGFLIIGAIMAIPDATSSTQSFASNQDNQFLISKPRLQPGQIISISLTTNQPINISFTFDYQDPDPRESEITSIFIHSTYQSRIVVEYYSSFSVSVSTLSETNVTIDIVSYGIPLLYTQIYIVLLSIIIILYLPWLIKKHLSKNKLYQDSSIIKSSRNSSKLSQAKLIFQMETRAISAVFIIFPILIIRFGFLVPDVVDHFLLMPDYSRPLLLELYPDLLPFDNNYYYYVFFYTISQLVFGFTLFSLFFISIFKVLNDNSNRINVEWYQPFNQSYKFLMKSLIYYLYILIPLIFLIVIRFHSVIQNYNPLFWVPVIPVILLVSFPTISLYNLIYIILTRRTVRFGFPLISFFFYTSVFGPFLGKKRREEFDQFGVGPAEIMYLKSRLDQLPSIFQWEGGYILFVFVIIFLITSLIYLVLAVCLRYQYRHKFLERFNNW
jgi:hypothetical protein